MHRHYMEKGRSDSGGGFPRQSSPMSSFLAVAPLPFPRRVSAVPQPGRLILHPLLDVC